MYASFLIDTDGSHALISVPGAWAGILLDVAGARHPASAYRDAELDYVSEQNLLAHIHARPPVPAFLAASPAAPPAASVTGAAFEAAWTGSHDFGDMVLNFVDERFGGAFALPPPVGLAPFSPDEESETVLVLADKTIIRLTGLLKGITRGIVPSTGQACAA